MFGSFHPDMALALAAGAFFLVGLTKFDRKWVLAYIAFVGVLFVLALTPGKEPLGDGVSTANYILPGIAAYGAWAVPSYAISKNYEHRQSHIALMGLTAVLTAVLLVVITYGRFSDFIGNVG